MERSPGVRFAFVLGWRSPPRWESNTVSFRHLAGFAHALRSHHPGQVGLEAVSHAEIAFDDSRTCAGLHFNNYLILSGVPESILPMVQEPKSFVSQSHYGIDLRCTLRGEIAGEQSRTGQNERHSTKCQGVRGLHAVEQAR
jgi:hypothetical protein